MAKVLLCALLEDGGRVLFLEREFGDTVKYSLPCVLVEESEDPVKALAGAVAVQVGIDCQVGRVAFTGRYNVGSRRRRQFVGVLVFECKAKNYSSRVKTKWVRLDEAPKLQLARECEWLKQRF